MIPSRYNQLCPIDVETTALYNPLSGAFDLVDGNLAEAVGKGEAPAEWRETLLERGYFFESKKDESDYIRRREQEFRGEYDGGKAQFLFVFSYACNFHCPYCYQKGVSQSGGATQPEVIDAFFDFVKQFRTDTGREVMVTLFGGEPLLPGEARKTAVRLFVERAAREGIGLSVVTNGYYFHEYAEILAAARVDEIHFTLDGDQAIHDTRRSESDGKGSFDRILTAMQFAVDKGFPVNLRLIVDRITLPTLPEIAWKLERLGFLDLPKERFKTSLGRNYELVNDYIRPEDLFTLDGMVAEYAALIQREPILAKLHTPSFFGIRELAENGEMYLPSFDTCPGAKSEFVLDGDGKVWSCTASCGRDGYSLGTFFPEVKLDETMVKPWKERSILTIPGCDECSVGVVCGGGCAVIANDRNGSVLSKDCKPVKAVMDTGIRYFRDKLAAMAEGSASGSQTEA